MGATRYFEWLAPVAAVQEAEAQAQEDKHGLDLATLSGWLYVSRVTRERYRFDGGTMDLLDQRGRMVI